MGDKRTSDRRRGIVKPGPTQYAINNQARIDERTRVLKTMLVQATTTGF
jgi:hypothetical protein